MGRHRLNKEQRARHDKWLHLHLPRVHQATRPNASYITEPQVLAVLQHLSDGVSQALMARPLLPFPWLADYLRHACKVGYAIEQDAATVLTLEMHKKRRVIQNALLDTQADTRECKRLITAIILQQQALTLPEEELLLTSDDLTFLATQTPIHQAQWSVDTSSIALPIPSSLSQEATHWIQALLCPRRHIGAYAETVFHGVTHALIDLELAAPENAAEWIVRFFQQYPHDTTAGNGTTNSPHLTLVFKTNYELMRKMETIKLAQRETHLKKETLEEIHSQLHDQLLVRQKYIDKLRVANVTTRTHAIMDGTSVFLNSCKHWILPGYLLLPQTLTPHELQGLQRAERFLMEQDEQKWRFLLLSQSRYDASIMIQAAWKCSRDYRVYKALTARRRHAASVIQRNYFHYLYHRAICLPAWCVVGREVVVAPSVAQKCAITFQFYPKKDFPTGNYKRLDGVSIAQLMEFCRQEEECAAFSTDGALKRFVPRKLSQLKEMIIGQNDGLTMKDGLYIKMYPSKTDQVVNTAIITHVPVDRFGVVTVVLDGTCVEEKVPVQKLFDRWKRVRIRRHYKANKPRKGLVFGGKKIVETSAFDDGNNEDDEEVQTMKGYDILETNEEEEELQRRRRRVRMQSNEQNAEDPLLDFVYEDQSTKEIRKREPQCTHTDDIERAQLIAKRKAAYDRAKVNEYEKKKLESVVRLQCAWRSKRAREAFRTVLALRAKEREREKLVSAVHSTNQQKKQQKQRPPPSKTGGFFAKWIRR